MSEWIYLLADGTLGQLTDEQDRALDVLIGAYERLHRLLQQLIDLMHGHEIVLVRHPISAQELVQQASVALVPRANARSVSLAVHMPEEPLTLEVDRGRCVAAIEYLIDNAIKFNREGGKVDVTLTPTATGAAIRVTDTGIGIPPEEQEKVFAPFYQVDRRLNRAYEGAGIGLTLAKRYVEIHGGSLDLASTVDAGTTITVTLPRPTVSAEHPALSAPTL
jgi:signal transduction histidine kinase